MTPEECKAVFERLSEYIDGDLPADTCEQIAEHIADCPPCVEFVKSLKKSVGVFREYKPGEEPAPLSEESKRELAEAYRAMLDRRATRNAR
jgi:RNA polymerase sigma-70 factor (ECF subfamily)